MISMCLLGESNLTSNPSNCLIVNWWCQQLNQPHHVISYPCIAQRTGMVCLIILLPRGILSIIIEANFRNWNDAQHKSRTNFFHDMKAEVRNQPLSHTFLHASKFPNWRTVKCSHYYNYLMLIINN